MDQERFELLKLRGAKVLSDLNQLTGDGIDAYPCAIGQAFELECAAEGLLGMEGVGIDDYLFRFRSGGEGKSNRRGYGRSGWCSGSN